MASQLTIHQQGEALRVAGGRTYRVAKVVAGWAYIHVIHPARTDVHRLPLDGPAAFVRSL